MSVSEPVNHSVGVKPLKWSRVGQLAKGAAIAEANRARSRGKPWSAKEMRIALDTYPDYVQMMERLPHRTLAQLKTFTRQYGIAKKRHVWTTHEIATLKLASREGWNWPQLRAALPHLRRVQIAAALKFHGLSLRQGFKELGVPVLDAVRERAYAMNLSLIDLDEICGGGVYWQKCIRKPNWRRIEKVLEFVGGRLIVDLAPLDKEV